jgi:hypothetical protein
MKAVVFHGIGDIRLDNNPERQLKDNGDWFDQRMPVWVNVELCADG